MSNSLDKINKEVANKNFKDRKERNLKDLMDGKTAEFIKKLDRVKPINKQLDNDKKIL